MSGLLLIDAAKWLLRQRVGILFQSLLARSNIDNYRTTCHRASLDVWSGLIDAAKRRLYQRAGAVVSSSV